jgi:translation elongation factor EF-1alpha
MKLEASWAYARITDDLFPLSPTLRNRCTKFTGEKQAFQQTPEVEIAFQTLKESLCTTPLLAYPQSRERFVVYKHASNVGIGKVLSQIQDGHEPTTVRR